MGWIAPGWFEEKDEFILYFKIVQVQYSLHGKELNQLLLCFIYSRSTAYILRTLVPKHILGKLYGRDNSKRHKSFTESFRTMLE